MLSNGSEFINWRLWLLFASQPWPYPTQQELLNLLVTYAENDTDQSGFISRGTYHEVLFNHCYFSCRHIVFSFFFLRFHFGFQSNVLQHLMIHLNHVLLIVNII
jgi:hypothetical protein